jgi:hypothetical protein
MNAYLAIAAFLGLVVFDQIKCQRLYKVCRKMICDLKPQEGKIRYVANDSRLELGGHFRSAFRD